MTEDYIIEEEDTCEYIRRIHEIPREKIAGLLGISLRTYATRVCADDPKWQLDELVAIAKLNKWKRVVAKSKGKTYEIKIKELY